MKKRTQGFTLIELVVATLIIGLLAAVLVPNALGARARANGSAVQTFMKNLSQEMETTYAKEGAYFPTGTFDDVNGYYPGGEVYFGGLSFVETFLSGDAEAAPLPEGYTGAALAGQKSLFDEVFEIAMPDNMSMVIKTDNPDAHSGYCVIARWNSRDTENYDTYILTPNEGIQVLEDIDTDAVTECPSFGEAVAGASEEPVIP